MISVYIPTHNRVDRLKKAVDSILNQTYKDFEICIVDDGSSDNTWKYCQELNNLYSNVKISKNEIPMGACAARNRAIFMASGDFITGLDDDDQFINTRLETFISCWDDSYSFICDNFLNVYDEKVTPHFNKGGVFSFESIKLNNEAGNQVFTKLERVKAVGGFGKDIRKLQDWDLWIRLVAQYGSMMRINSCSYRMNHGNGERVSNSMGYAEALEELIVRNSKLYNNDEIYLIRRYLCENRLFPNIFREISMFYVSEYRRFILKKLIRNILGAKY